MPGFTSSVPPDITETLPGVLGYAGASQQGGGDSTLRWDVSIGGTNFLLGANAQRPYMRQTAPIQKPQFDVSQEAGEQSFDQYWLRSQTSWHRGQGIQFYEPGYTSNAARFWEPGSDLITEYRYYESVGINPWTRDKAMLLYKMNSVATVGAGQLATVSGGQLADGTDCVWTNENGTVKRRTAAGTVTSYTPTANTPATRVAVCGSKIAIGHALGIDIADVAGSTFAAQWTQAAGATVVPYWCKGRIVAAIGPNLWTLPLTGTSGTIAANGQNIFTHPDPNFVWTSVCDTPMAIFATGYAGGHAEIYKFTLENATTGTLPIVGQGYQIATFPPGEIVNSICCYVGGYLGIATTRGVRVAVIDINGNIQYGPLIVELANGSTDITGNGSYLYATVNKEIDGYSGAVRINLGEPLPHDNLRFAYCWDAQTHNLGVPTSIAFIGSTTRVCLGVNGEAVYTQDATHYESSGYILSGRIRFKTTEQKIFRQAVLRGSYAGASSITLSSLDENLTETSVYTVSAAGGDGSDIFLGQAGGKHQYLQFRTTLTASADGLSSPTLYSLLIKAIPAPKRQRLIQYPLLCNDHEQDALGTPFGYGGFAWARIAALEAAESSQVVLSVNDYTNGESYDGVVEEIDFERPFGRALDGSANFGGFLKVTMRILT